MTDRPGVFAGGDAQMGARTVIECVAQGKLAAKAIDRYLAGDDMARVAEEIAEEEAVPELIDIVPYKPEEPQVRMPMLPFKERELSFQLIENGYDKNAAEKEAARCLQCVCPDVGRCHLQRLSLEHGLTDNRFHRAEPVDYHDYEYDFSHDFILRDLNKCINCTQCVRICRDVIGANCYGLMGGGYDAIVTTPWNVSLKYTDCVSCGACAETCPTGALMMRERDLQTSELDVTRCIYCGDCVEVCPHGVLGETSHFVLSTYGRFVRPVLSIDGLYVSRSWQPSGASALTRRVPRVPRSSRCRRACARSSRSRSKAGTCGGRLSRTTSLPSAASCSPTRCSTRSPSTCSRVPPMAFAKSSSAKQPAPLSRRCACLAARICAGGSPKPCRSADAGKRARRPKVGSRAWRRRWSRGMSCSSTTAAQRANC